MNFLNEVLLFNIVLLLLIGNTVNVKAKVHASYSHKVMLQEKFLNSMKS